jgi:hypothetical protein
MIDYEKLKGELNQFGMYLLNSIKRDYGAYFSDKNQTKINNMLKCKTIVEIDTKVDNKMVHINPNMEIFKTGDYKKIKNYFYDNYLINALLTCFITLSISERKFKHLKEPNENQSCCIYLRKGLISQISLELADRCRLEIPDIYNEQSLGFINMIKNRFPNISIKSYAFLDDYLEFKNKFYKETNEDILELYKEYKTELKNNKNTGVIELLEVDDYLEKSFGR